jgi:hypothetical protein
MQEANGIQRKPAVRYVELIGEILQLADAIRSTVSDQVSPQPCEVNWAHVGDATWTRNQLKHVLAVIRGEEGK